MSQPRLSTRGSTYFLVMWGLVEGAYSENPSNWCPPFKLRSDIGGAIMVAKDQGWCIFLPNEELFRRPESSKSQGSQRFRLAIEYDNPLSRFSHWLVYSATGWCMRASPQKIPETFRFRNDSNSARRGGWLKSYFVSPTSKLCGGSKSFLFHPDPFGYDPICRAYFSNGLVQPPFPIVKIWNHPIW